MHLLRSDMEPNIMMENTPDAPHFHEGAGRATTSAPVGDVDWRQHYPRRQWCYRTLLEALSVEYNQEKKRSAQLSVAEESNRETLRDVV